MLPIESLCDVVAYLSRRDVEALELSSAFFSDIVTTNFVDKPLRRIPYSYIKCDGEYDIDGVEQWFTGSCPALSSGSLLLTPDSLSSLLRFAYRFRRCFVERLL